MWPPTLMTPSAPSPSTSGTGCPELLPSACTPSRWVGWWGVGRMGGGAGGQAARRGCEDCSVHAALGLLPSRQASHSLVTCPASCTESEEGPVSDEERERRVRLFTPWIERLVALIRGRVRACLVLGCQHSCPAAPRWPALDCCHCLSPSLTCHGDLPPSHYLACRCASATTLTHGTATSASTSSVPGGVRGLRWKVAFHFCARALCQPAPPIRRFSTHQHLKPSLLQGGGWRHAD